MTADELAAKYGVATAPATSSADALAAKYGVADQELPDEEPSTPPRQFNNTGPIEDIRAQTAADKAAIANPQGDKVADTGLAGLITGKPQPSSFQSGAVGASQGATLGFGDEAAGVIDTLASHHPTITSFAQALGLYPKVPAEALNPALTYKERRDAYRAQADEAKAAHPKAYLAGELIGGAVAPVPGGKAIEGASTARKIVQAAKTGAKVGALAGLGNSKADTVTGAAIDTGLGAAGGAVVGGGLQAVGSAVKGVAKSLNPSDADALKAAGRWVEKDLQGEVRGASTPTARKQVGMDAANVSKIVLRDKGLREAIDGATEQSVDHLEHANNVVHDRLATVGKKLSPNWSRIDAATADAPLTSGQVVGHLDTDAAALRATGRTTDAAEAKALEDISARLKTAKDWGAGKTSVDLTKPVQGGPFDGMPTDKAIAYLEKSKAKVADASQLEAEISRIKADATTAQGFDPNHQVPVEQLQKLWSDEAGIAYNNMGSINGTATFERKLDVASHLRDLRDQVVARAAQKDPEAVAAMTDDLAHYSALKRIEKVLDQRTNHAKYSGGGASIPEEFHRRLKEFKHAPVGTTLGMAAESVVKAKKDIDTAAALRAIDGAKDPVLARRAWNALLSTKGGKAGAKVTAAIAAGIPRVLAMQAARTITAQSQPQ